MGLGHEKLDGYRLAISYVAWVYEKADSLTGNHRSARDQWLRASQSIPLNIAEGNGKAAAADRRRYFEIARGSALECAANTGRSGRRKDVGRVGKSGAQGGVGSNGHDAEPVGRERLLRRGECLGIRNRIGQRRSRLR